MCIWNPQVEERGGKIFEKPGAIILPDDENYKSTDSRNSTHFKHREYKENYTKAYYNQIAQNSDEEKNLKTAREKLHICTDKQT